MSDTQIKDTHISIQNFNTYYSGHQALKNISVDMPKNKITAIIGPSGCGKSTLLKCMNRLIDLTDGATCTGKILIDGKDIFDKKTDITDIRKKMGLLAQKPTPLPMSIYENVAYGPRIHGARKKAKLDAVVEKCLTMVGLWEEVKSRLDSPASKLSIGQQQRLCLARGLAVEPEIILCDEPTSALDPLSSQHIEEQLLRLKKDYTIVIAIISIRPCGWLIMWCIFTLASLWSMGLHRKYLKIQRKSGHELILRAHFSLSLQ